MPVSRENPTGFFERMIWQKKLNSIMSTRNDLFQSSAINTTHSSESLFYVFHSENVLRTFRP